MNLKTNFMLTDLDLLYNLVSNARTLYSQILEGATQKELVTRLGLITAFIHRSHQADSCAEMAFDASVMGAMTACVPIKQNLIMKGGEGYLERYWSGGYLNHRDVRAQRQWLADNGCFDIEEGNFFQKRRVPFLINMNYVNLLVCAEQIESILVNEYGYYKQDDWRDWFAMSPEQQMFTLPPQMREFRDRFHSAFHKVTLWCSNFPVVEEPVLVHVKQSSFATLADKFKFIRDQIFFSGKEVAKEILYRCYSLRDVGMPGEECDYETEFAIAT